MPKRDSAKLKKVAVSLPFGLGSAEWESDPTERKTAWELYVELVTRVAVEPMAAGEGVIREALSSLHSLYPTTREILRKAGPDVGFAHDTVGGVAIAVLNRGLRPFLTKWHPLLQTWEEQRRPGTSIQDHERSWNLRDEFYQEFSSLREELNKFAAALASIAGVSP